MLDIKLPTIFLSISIIYSQSSPPTLEISTGLLQGTHQTSYNGRTFSAFEGIPYASPPVGELRFEPPHEPYNWTGTLIADKKYICIQSFVGLTELGVAGQEDCLYINIYVPRAKPSSVDNLNVIVHIHGGAYMLGSPLFYAGPEFLMDEEVILVTMNYRLGPFGFLSTEDEILPGNNGLKDQVQSLKWIQKNIKFFGGNPNSVTATGLSSGASSLHYHYFSPLSKGLFHRGFSQSGTALNPWALQEAALEKTKHLAAVVGCSSTTSKELLQCLKGVPAHNITDSVKYFFGYSTYPFSPFAPVIEKEHDGAFLTKHPYRMLVDKQVADVPWVTSASEREGMYPGAFFANKLEELQKEFDRIAPYVLDYNYTITTSQMASLTDEIKNYYFKGSINLPDFITLLGDRHFLVAANMAAKLQAKANKSPVYFYLISYRGEHSFYESYMKNNGGAAHGDDAYHYLYINGRLSKSDEEMKSLFMQWILNFANDGKPKLEMVEWTPVKDEKALHYLHFKNPNEIHMAMDENLGAHNFWSKLPFKENENYN